MTAYRKRRAILWLLIALTLCFIWGNSLVPRAQSTQISEGVHDALKLPSVYVTQEDGEIVDLIEQLLRKLAHMTEFLILSIWFALLAGAPMRSKLALLVLCGAGAALMDETIQLFSLRGSSVADVWIDIAGFCLGLALVTAVRKMRRRKKSS